LLAYISLVDIRPDASSLDAGTMRKAIGEGLDAHEDWIVHLKDGSRAEWWPTYTIMNITDYGKDSEGSTFRDFFIDEMRDRIINDAVWDGVFYDNLWESVSFVSNQIDLNRNGVAESPSTMDAAWKNGIAQALQATRDAADEEGREDFIITGNGGTAYYEQLNGVGFEHFPDTVYGGWTASMEQYFFVMQHIARDPFALINTNVQNSENQTNYQKFRYGLTSTLLGNGYYSFDSGDETHHERWYYDEYSVMLGEATSAAYNVQNPNDTTLNAGVWRRDFEHASVLVNSTNSSQFVDLKEAYEKIRGTQDLITNSGETVGSVTIPAHDGIILLNRLSTITHTTYLNGAYAKAFNATGEAERNSFFEYTPSFTSYTQIHTLKKKTIVADSTNVRIYKNNGTLLTTIQPYGSNYTGGVDIAVGKTKKNKNIIVVGNRTGLAQVKIYSMAGEEKAGSGCTPFGHFYGGLDVAVGNKNREGKLRIVVGAGDGGGPQVQVLNSRCEAIQQGFFAYDSSYRTGVHVAVGDVNGDGRDDIITAPGQGGGPQVRIFTRRGKMLQAGFFAYDTSDRSGVWLSTADIDDDGVDEIVTNSFSIFNSF
ncbi:MAG: putative glycoside hydrolase, partial [Candidatus Kerfeldbacteria bacterium]|nr:putative glycoside hydrolase [Candidatus Kerfeldbacteria bacterium]